MKPRDYKKERIEHEEIKKRWIERKERRSSKEKRKEEKEKCGTDRPARRTDGK